MINPSESNNFITTLARQSCPGTFWEQSLAQLFFLEARSYCLVPYHLINQSLTHYLSVSKKNSGDNLDKQGEFNGNIILKNVKKSSLGY